jgi:protease PrsW
MLLLALSIAPGIAISLYIFLKDRFNREPHLNLLVCFLLGCLSIIPAVIIQLLTVKPVERLMGGGILYTAVFAYLIVGLSEEWSKYIMLRSYAYPRKSFDEPFDGIVYSVMIGMGFATVENILYVQQHGLGTAILRMFLSVPAHATFAVLMGYFAGKAKFKPERRKFYLFTGIFWAAFFHGTYDFFLFLQGNPTVNKYLSDSLLFVGAVASFIFAVWLSKKAIKEHHNLSKNMFHPDI